MREGDKAKPWQSGGPLMHQGIVLIRKGKCLGRMCGGEAWFKLRKYDGSASMNTY